MEMKTTNLADQTEEEFLARMKAAREAHDAQMVGKKRTFRCAGCGRKIRRIKNPLVDGLCSRCRRFGAPDMNAEPKAVNLLGFLGRETDKAIFFSPVGDSRGEIGPAWWPKKVCGFKERAQGPLDEISVPIWLLKQKQEEAR